MAREKFLAPPRGGQTPICGDNHTAEERLHKGPIDLPSNGAESPIPVDGVGRGEIPVHGSNKGLSFANVVNNDNGDRGDARDGDAQASGGSPSCDGATETRRN